MPDKFRVWDILNKRMLEWGEIMHLPAWEIFPGKPEQRAFEVMQYTGLKDISSDPKEVFEDDIILFHYKGEPHIGRVKFEVGMFIIVCEELPDRFIPISEIAESDGDYFWIKGKIIGNVHEQPGILD